MHEDQGGNEVKGVKWGGVKEVHEVKWVNGVKWGANAVRRYISVARDYIPGMWDGPCVCCGV